jgi:hypothetical protein
LKQLEEWENYGSFPSFWLKNVFNDNAVKKSVRMGQSLMIINNFFPLKTLSIVLIYFIY